MNRQILDLSAQNFADVLSLSDSLTKEKIVYHIKLLEEAYMAMNKSDVKRIIAEITLMRLALSKYDSSIEALEARVAELEVGNGYTVIPQTVVQSGAPQSPSNDQAVKPSVTVPKTNEEKKSQIAITQWVDIIGEYEAKDPSTSSFLKNTKATLNTATNELTVWTLDGFAVMMLNNDQTKNTILQLASRFGVNAATVIVSLKPKAIAEDDPLADLLNDDTN